MPSSARPAGAGLDPAAPDPRRWWALASVVLAQLMVILDLTIMNVALPSLQSTLGLSDEDRQWVVTVYALAFGSLLLLGGRLSDLIGRRRALLIGLAGFALASAVGGLAQDTPTMLVARGAQGVFGALLTPSVTALVAVMFPEPRERGRAFGLIGTIVGAGAGVGLIAGGVLTDLFSWRAAFMVNLPFAAVAAAGVLLTVAPIAPRRSRVDVPGAVLATGALGAMVFGASRATIDGWGSAATLAPIAVGLALAVAFVGAERRSDHPLLPLRVLGDRRRVAAMLAAGTVGLGNIPAQFSLGVYLQEVRGDSPLMTGVALLPGTLVILVLAQVVGRLLPRVALRSLLVPGLLALAAGLALMADLRVDGPYVLTLLPVLLLLGVGIAFVMPPANSAATQNAGADTGVAGALVPTSLQVGVSFGSAIFGSLAATSARDYATAHPGVADLAGRATTHGIGSAGLAAAGVAIVLAVVVFLVGAGRPPSRTPAGLPVPAPAAQPGD